MDDLVQFLRDRLDEDVTEAGKLDDGDDWEMESWQVRRDETGTYDSYAYLRIAKTRVLTEVDAKRRILAIHRRFVEEAGQACLGCAGGIEWEACPIVRLLAMPYADHPDYQPEWAPDQA